MHRFYVSAEIQSSPIVLTDAEQLHHMRDVLRLHPGDEVAVFDSRGNGYVSIIQSVNRQQATLEIREAKQVPRIDFELAVGCALPKKSLMDDIVDKLTQLGVDRIVPLLTERVVTNRADGWSLKLERWQKIALSAARQSQRNTLPVILDPLSLSAAIADVAGYDLRLIATLSGESQPLREVFAGLHPKSIVIFIGPEGDFTSSEVEQARASGFRPISLGNTVLRVETAAIAVASYLRLALA